MAKQTIVIDTKHATKNIDALGKSVSAYNLLVKDQVKSVKDLNRTSEALNKATQTTITNQRNYSQALRSSNTALDSHKIALQTSARTLGNISTAYQRLSPTVFQNVLAFKTLTTQMQTFERATARQISVTQTITASLNRERIAIDSTSTRLAAFGQQIAQITSQMRRKNTALTDQTRELKKDSDAVLLVTASYRTLIRVLVIQTIHRAFSRFLNEIRESLETFRLLRIAIAEIRTIQGEVGKSTAEWEKELIGLSTAFGIPVLEVAAAEYEAISNQVVNATNATRFMRDELELAITTQANLKTATNATSTVINAFRKSSQEATVINAKLFKTVELGRIRLDELGSQFGRVSVLSNQLGITFDEQQAALTTLTRQGVDAEHAQVLLANVMNALLSPSKEMNAQLSEWGVQTGGAAVKTFGFVGVLRRLAAIAESTGDPLQHIADIFSDLRALTGAGGLVAGFKDFESDLRRISNSQESFNAAIQESVQNTGRRITIELNKVKNEFLKTFGESLSNAFLTVIDLFGGADKALHALGGAIRVVTSATLAYIVVQKVLNTNFAAMNVSLIKTRTGFALLNLETKKITASFTTMQIAQGALSLGLTAVVAVAIESVFAYNRLTDSLKEYSDALSEAEQRQSELDIKKFAEESEQAFGTFSQAVSANFKVILQAYAILHATNNELAEKFEKNFAKIGKSVHKELDTALDGITSRLRESERELDKIFRTIERSKEAVSKIRIGEVEKRFEASLAGKAELEAFQLIENEKIRLHRAALVARAKGEEEVAEAFFSRVEALGERQAEILKKELADATKEKEKVSHVEFKTDAFGRPKFDRRGRPQFKRVTETVADPDEERQKKALETLNALEAERQRLVLERIRAEEAATARAEAAAEASRARIDEQQAAVARLRDILAQLDSFDTTQVNAAGAFRNLAAQAEAEADAAGLSPTEKLTLLRDAKRQELELVKKAAVEQAQAAVQAQQDALLKAQRLHEQETQNLRDALGKRKEEIANFVNENKKFLNDLQTQFLPNAQDRHGEARGGAFVFPGNNPEEEAAAKKQLAQLQVLIKQQAIQLDIAKQKFKNDEVDLGLLQRIRDTYDEIRTLSIKINPNRLAPDAGPNAGLLAQIGQDLKAVTTGLGGEFAKGGKLAIPEGEQVIVIIDKLKQQFTGLAQAQQRVIEANQRLGDSNSTLQQLAFIADQIKAKGPDVGLVGLELAQGTVSAQQQVNDVLRGTVTHLQTIADLQQRIMEINRAFFGGGNTSTPVKGSAFGGPIGGRGIDRIPVMMADGETVMSQMASRTFAPILAAMNHAPPVFRAQGGTVTNIGDIHVHPPQGTSREQVIHIARELKRLGRQGLN